MSQFHLQAVDTTPEAPVPRYEVSIVASSVEKDAKPVLLAGPCRDGSEVDDAIDRLITQLNAIRHKAKEKLTDGLQE